MARKKRGGLVEAEEHFSDSDRDSVDEHVARRHARLEAEAKGSDSDSDSAGPPEATEREVLEIDLSDSEDDGPLKKPSASNIADTSDDEDADGQDDEEQEEEDDGNWGGRRRKYYGVDTEEHEIMEDEEREEALAEEEAEAVRLQRKQLADLTADDYGVPATDEDDESEKEGDEEEPDISAPELGGLASELEKYYGELALWSERTKWGDKARTRYHLYAAYTSNIAYYFVLRTDPDAVDIDCRSHDVLRRIVELRTLITKHETVPIPVPEKEPPSPIATKRAMEKKSSDAGRSQAGEKKNKSNTRENESSAKKKKSDGLESDIVKKKKRKEMVNGKESTTKEKKRKKKKKTVSVPVEDKDDALFESLLAGKNDIAPTAASKSKSSSEKRQRLNRITGALDSASRKEKERRVFSADIDHVRDPATYEKRLQLNESVVKGDGELEALNDEEFAEKLIPKKRKRKEKEAPVAHVYTFDDKADVNERRRASTQVALNKGLTRYRPKEKKTPRTKNKAAYAKAVKKRKTVVRDAVAVKPGVSYGGEASGINMNVRKGARLSDF